MVVGPSERLDPLGRASMLLGPRARAGSGRTRRREGGRAGTRTRVSPATASAARAGRTPCARASAADPRPRCVGSPSRATPPSQKTLPSTAASCSSSFSSAGSASRRAAMMPCTDSGSVAPLSPRSVEHARRTAPRRADCRLRARAAPLHLGGQQRLLEQSARRAAARLVVARAARARSSSRSPCRLPSPAPLQELRPRGAEDEQRNARPSRRGSRRSPAARRRPSADPRRRARRAPRSAIASRNRRQAANASRAGRPGCRRRSSPTSGAQLCDRSSAPRRRRDEPSTRRASFRSASSAASRLEDARLRLDDLAERPEGHALAVRETAALPPRDQLRVGVDRPGRARRPAGSCRSRERRRA